MLTEAVAFTNNIIYKSIRQQQTNKNIPLRAVCLHWFCAILFTNILWISFGLKLISNIDDVIVYNTTGAHAAEVRVGCLYTHYRQFSQSQHTGAANQSESIAYFWGRGLIKALNYLLVYRWREAAFYNLGSWLAALWGNDFAGSVFPRRHLTKLISDRLLRQRNGLMIYNKIDWDLVITKQIFNYYNNNFSAEIT